LERIRIILYLSAGPLWNTIVSLFIPILVPENLTNPENDLFNCCPTKTSTGIRRFLAGALIINANLKVLFQNKK
jgi:hypothetical protein